MDTNVTTATEAWLDTMRAIISRGQRVDPRGKETKELKHHCFKCDMSDPVIRVPERKLSYTFAAAEALWILNGDDTVEGIAPHNKRIAQFSDDGRTFFGAYGPRFVAQLDHVVNTLTADRDTRQATMTLWRPNPPATRDYPCTVALDFKIRSDQLDCHVFMRSSDAWLGLPYDQFNFTTLAAQVACRYVERGPRLRGLGTLFITAASSHLYATDFEKAAAVLDAPCTFGPVARSLQSLVIAGDWHAIETSLEACRANNEAQWSAPWLVRPRSQRDDRGGKS